MYLSRNPWKQKSPLLNIKNREKLVLTPHIAWASVEARQTLLKEVAHNIEAFLRLPAECGQLGVFTKESCKRSSAVYDDQRSCKY